MMINQNDMTFRFALAVLEAEYNSIYWGTRTVRDMPSSLIDAIMWETESPDKVYHVFETRIGTVRLVADDQVIPLAKHYHVTPDKVYTTA